MNLRRLRRLIGHADLAVAWGLGSLLLAVVTARFLPPLAGAQSAIDRAAAYVNERSFVIVLDLVFNVAAAIDAAVRGGLLSFLPLALAIVAVLLWRLRLRVWLVADRRGRRLRSGWHALGWLAIAIGHPFVDAEPALVGPMVLGAGASLWFASGASGRARRWRTIVPAAIAVAVAGWPLAFNRADRLTLLTWLAIQIPVTFGMARMPYARNRVMVVLMSVMLGQAIGLRMPYALANPVPPVTNGDTTVHSVVLGDAQSYDFCENTARKLLVATVMGCDANPRWKSDASGPYCAASRLDLFRADDLQRVDSWYFAQPDFSGRAEQPLCMDDRVLVGLCCVTDGGEHVEGRLVEFDWQGRLVSRGLFNGQMFNRMVVDGRTGSQWYAGVDLLHVDGASGRRTIVRRGSELAGATPPQGAASGARGRAWQSVMLLDRLSLDVDGRRLYVGRWPSGNGVFAYDLDTLALRHTLPTWGGGVDATTVDAAKRRLYVATLWGFEVFDLDSGALVRRTRVGMLPRAPAIDDRHGLILVATTASGKIYVFDRDTLDLVGSVAVGTGTKNTYVSNDRRWILAGSNEGYWAWDAAGFAAHFRTAASP